MYKTHFELVLMDG